MSATRCSCIGDLLLNDWIVLVPDETCRANHPGLVFPAVEEDRFLDLLG